MDIEITRGIQLQEEKPESVRLLLIDDEGKVKASIHVSPKFLADSDLFRVEIAAGDVSIKPPLLIEFDI